MPEQKLLPPAQEGRIYHDHNQLVKSQQLLRLYDDYDHANECLRYYKQHVEGIQCSLQRHQFKDPKSFNWRTLSQHEKPLFL